MLSDIIPARNKANIHVSIANWLVARENKEYLKGNTEMGITVNNILIIEDDISLADGLCRALTSENIKALGCHTIKEARTIFQNRTFFPDMVLLDVNLPDGNGFDFLKEIKERYSISVILLTANDLETDIVAGLESGADDYITKPFSLAVLRARVNTALRRKNASGETEAASCVKFADYFFDFYKMEFFYQDEKIELSKTEQKLLRMLTKHIGNTLSRGLLMDAVWTDGAEYVDENALSVTIKRLRDKLHAGEYIKTVYGIGYVWKIP